MLRSVIEYGVEIFSIIVRIRWNCYWLLLTTSFYFCLLSTLLSPFVPSFCVVIVVTLLSRMPSCHLSFILFYLFLWPTNWSQKTRTGGCSPQPVWILCCCFSKFFWRLRPVPSHCASRISNSLLVLSLLRSDQFLYLCISPLETENFTFKEFYRWFLLDRKVQGQMITQCSHSLWLWI